MPRSISVRVLALASTLALGIAAVAPAAAQESGFDARFAAARAQALGGQRGAAIAAYTALLAESPGNADVLLGRGRVYAWEGRWPEAEADLLAATQVSPDYADAWSALGDMYLWSDRPAQAAEAYARWQSLAPDSAEAAAAHGRALRAAAGPARPADAQAGVDGAYRWTGSLSAGVTDTSNAGTWHDAGASLRRRFDAGSVALEWMRASRFGTSDHALALDAYVDLWARAYANLRYQHAGGDGLYPGNAWRAELYQGAGRGWELSASYDRLGFAGGATEIYGAGVGRYWGDFYARARVTRVPGLDSDSTAVRALLRWYYAGNGDDYLEVAGGSGRSAAELAQLGAAARFHSTSASVAWARWFDARWGLRLGAGYANDDAAGRIERDVSISLSRRW
jgi:YaiO family outer membrane protein